MTNPTPSAAAAREKWALDLAHDIDLNCYECKGWYDHTLQQDVAVKIILEAVDKHYAAQREAHAIACEALNRLGSFQAWQKDTVIYISTEALAKIRAVHSGGSPTSSLAGRMGAHQGASEETGSVGTAGDAEAQRMREIRQWVAENGGVDLHYCIQDDPDGRPIRDKWFCNECPMAEVRPTWHEAVEVQMAKDNL